jgi:hypothetical protein
MTYLQLTVKSCTLRAMSQTNTYAKHRWHAATKLTAFGARMPRNINEQQQQHQQQQQV